MLRSGCWTINRIQRGSGGVDLDGPYMLWAATSPDVIEGIVGLGGRDELVMTGEDG